MQYVGAGLAHVECMGAGLALEAWDQIRNNFSRPRFPVNLHQCLYLYVLDKPRVEHSNVGPH